MIFVLMRKRSDKHEERPLTLDLLRCVSLQLPHFLICTRSHRFRTRSLSLQNHHLPTRSRYLSFSLSLSNTITRLVSFCAILVSTSLESSVGLATIGRSIPAFTALEIYYQRV